MSHSRVSLGRTAIPCTTGGVEGRLWDQGRGGAGPACRARLTAPFLLPPPSPPSSHFGFLLVCTSLCCAGRGGYGVRRSSSCPQSAFRRPPANAFLFLKKGTAEGARVPRGIAGLQNTIRVT